MGDLLKRLLEGIVQVFSGVFAWLADYFTRLFHFVIEWVSNLLRKAYALVSLGIAWLVAMISDIVDTLRTSVQDFALYRAIENLIDFDNEAVSDLLDALNIGLAIKIAIIVVSSQVFSYMGLLLRKVIDWVVGLL